MSEMPPIHFEWNYYSADHPRAVEDGIKMRSERGAIGETWWSKRWVQALEALGMGSRLTRGKSYARMGQVLSIEVLPGQVKAQVQGSQRNPYAIDIRLQPLSDADWAKVTEAMATQAVFAAKLLAGEMPTNIEDAFKSVHLSLFPTAEQDLRTDCSCPDWANPCKHAAAVYFILAEQFDDDPFLIFKLRGRSKDEILAVLKEKRNAILPAIRSSSTLAADPSEAEPEATLRLEDYKKTFWQAGEELDSFVTYFNQDSIDKSVLRRLGSAPFSLGRENLTVILGKAYDLIYTATANTIEGFEL